MAESVPAVFAGEGFELYAICDGHHAPTRVLVLVPPVFRRRAIGNRSSGVMSARPCDDSGSPGDCFSEESMRDLAVRARTGPRADRRLQRGKPRRPASCAVLTPSLARTAASVNGTCAARRSGQRECDRTSGPPEVLRNPHPTVVGRRWYETAVASSVWTPGAARARKRVALSGVKLRHRRATG